MLEVNWHMKPRRNMSYESSAHVAQIAILRHLLFCKEAGFAELQRKTQLTSDHFNFHVKKLIDEGYVLKQARHYCLTRKGKEYANRLDTDEHEIEKQPKISIVIALERRGENNRREFLFQQRKKNPFYDFWGRASGKIRWGETVVEAAKRELKEETGLEADFEYKLLYHKRDYDKATGELLEDKIFLCVYSNEYSGDLIEEFEGGVNRWMTMDELLAQRKRFVSIDDMQELIDGGEHFVEREFYYDESEY